MMMMRRRVRAKAHDDAPLAVMGASHRLDSLVTEKGLPSSNSFVLLNLAGSVESQTKDWREGHQGYRDRDRVDL